MRLMLFGNRSLAPSLLVALTLICASLGHAQVTPSTRAYVSEASVPAVLDVDLRSLPPAAKWKPGDPVVVPPEISPLGGPIKAVEGWTDPVLQVSGPLFFGNQLFSFVPSGSINRSPPDGVGATGPNHYISMVNASLFAVWDKQGNNLVPLTPFKTLFSTSPCEDGGVDPIVQYDHAADRWLMSVASYENAFCIAVSRGANPITSGWFVYDFAAPDFPDYPQYGVWNDAYFVATAESPSLGIYAFDRHSMLAGRSASFQRFAIPELGGTAAAKHHDGLLTRILPADAEGPTPPPSGLPAVFLRTVHSSQDSSNPNTRIELWEYEVDFANGANSSFTLAQTLTPAPWAMFPCEPTPRECIPQRGTSSPKLEGFPTAAMRDLKYRNFGTHESMVVSQMVDAGGGVAGLRWWELRRTPTESGVSPWEIYQEGTYSPDSEHRFLSSIAMNGNGDIALGYSVSSSQTFAAIRATARRASDPLGVMTMEEITLVPGQNRSTANSRWGDYSSMDVDPADDSTFWYINQIIGWSDSHNVFARQVWAGVFQLNGGQIRSPSGELSGSYYDPARPGEGLFIEVGQVGERRVLFVSWYTYFQGMQRWIIGNVDFPPGATEVTVPLTVTAGTGFGSEFNPVDVQYIPWGSATFRFLSCTELGFDWQSDDGDSGSYSYVRLVDGLLGVGCQ